ncbi:NAD(P)/FAD-dependent oxidoreductase [Leptolyngbya sp. FACHB-8]|uniref:NAD(P)/FAD-dependent oxidoreductase n=1 Tax=unclassified Leptolyngbya TaxID=2650499 RepID=UPI0016896A73|nr:NAD(P)/FAD-dependent oxidoreductase [Leptolyngbya sp. FACHB-8]MBD1910012.1 NAD(P)/FAD-dependent oxidoreductase [Leptolyngbya sp. FACHB-8]
MNSPHPTVIVGAGFTGLFTALHLRHQHDLRSVILIDPQERFVFKPLLYELLTDELTEDSVCPTYKELLQGSNVSFVQDKVVAIDLGAKHLMLASGSDYTYAHLVLAVGSIQGYLGTEGAQENAFAFRTREDVIALKHQLRECLQSASQMKDEVQRRSLLTFAVVGAGPTGVEMAATLADLLPYWYAQLGGDMREIRIVLVNHGKTILAGDVNAGLKENALHAFRTRTVPVELILGVSVKSVDADHLEYQPAGSTETKMLLAQTTIWTAGTAVNPLIQTLKSQIRADHLDKHGLPLVSPTLQLLDFPEVFAAGDCADVQQQPQPALAQVAYQQGASIAHNLIMLTNGASPNPARVSLRGTLMKLGLNNGVANLFDEVQVTGKPADLIRSAAYLELLPTPLHDFKATTEWLKQETFHRYHRPKLESETAIKHPLSPVEKRERSLIKALAVVAPIIFLIAAYFGLRTPPSEELRQPQSSTTQPVP